MQVNNWLNILACAALVLTASTVHADPFRDADLANGKTLNDSKRCAACHIEKTGHSEAAFYQRPDRRVKTLFDLRRQVSLCNSELRLELFPEDERDIAAYLNKTFYKLEK